MKNKGFTIIELAVAIGIVIIVFTIVFTTYVTGHRLWRGGFTQLTFQSSGRIVLGKISGNLRLATEATILDSGDRIRFVTDPNRTPQASADDVTSEYYVSGTDMIYDPDISTAGDEVILLRYVYKVQEASAIPFFQNSGSLIVITFRVYSSDAVHGTYWSNMSTSVKMRNV